ncbi:MAG: hypothetical protein LQ341_000209 [Variospora aurantia]|nr:MAG: hypothetical protein LQ341_000209 [Variospora aurantia]
MCLSVTVRRSNDGRLTQGRLPPAKPVSVISLELQPLKKDPAPSKSHPDPLAAPFPSSPPISSDNSSSAKDSVQPKAGGPVKQHASKKSSPTITKEPATTGDTKQTESNERQHKTASIPTLSTVNPVQTPNPHAPRTLNRAVEFSTQLTCGPGRSYTPPSSDEQTVRFAPSLIRGRGSSYSDPNPRKIDVFPFERSSTGSAKQPKITSHVNFHHTPRSSISQPLSAMTAQHIYPTDRLSIKGKQIVFDTASDSDDSFTDVVLPTKPVRGSGSHRRKATPRYLHQPTVTPALMEATVAGGQNGQQFEVGDYESYVDAATTENTRRNTTMNRRTDTSSIVSGDLENSLRRSWPQPVFVFKGKNLPNRPVSQSPVFVVRDRSNSKGNADAFGNHSKAASMAKRPKWWYQPPSVTDADLDDAVYWDPARDLTTRDA